ncbi:MAG: patatin-like phospholipase family protein [Rhodospirillales bacterium]
MDTDTPTLLGPLPPESTADRIALLRSSELMAGLPPDLVGAIAEEMEFLRLTGGTVLFNEGEASDALFYVFRGCMGVFEKAVDAAKGKSDFKLIAEVSAGETVGELSLIAGRKHSATVAALRDSELWRLSRGAFERLTATHPDATAHLLRFIVTRLDRVIRHETQPHPPRSFTLLPVGPGVPASRVAVLLSEALNRLGGEVQVLTSESAGRDIEWFHRVETQSAYVLYLADAADTPWTRLCLRQADRILLLGMLDDMPASGLPSQVVGEQLFKPRRELVLLRHKSDLPPGRAAAWVKGHPDLNHRHLRVGVARDYDRLARLMTDKSVGAVFAGGGARAFAQIGVIRALYESGIPIDRIGGTSMGALIGASFATGADWKQVREMFYKAFVATNPLTDYTLPFVSLFAGRKVTKMLQASFGEFEIEDLQRPFFCVAADLTDGKPEVIRRGKVWQALRASISLPGILPPVVRNGHILVDGGVIDNLPIEIMRSHSQGIVLGVDIETAGAISAGEGVEHSWSAWQFLRRLIWKRGETLPFPSIVRILLRSALVSSDAASAMHRAAADLVFRPPTSQIDLLDWKALDQMIEVGYRHALEKIDKIRDLDIAKKIYLTG